MGSGTTIAGGGSFRGGGAIGGSNLRPPPTGRAPIGGAGVAARVGGGPVYGGGYRGGYRYHHRGFYPSAVAGALIGGTLASQSYAYYNDPAYYYDDGYIDDRVVAVSPDGGDVSYCRRKYRSYDVSSGTYLGYDGQRHPCP